MIGFALGLLQLVSRTCVMRVQASSFVGASPERAAARWVSVSAGVSPAGFSTGLRQDGGESTVSPAVGPTISPTVLSFILFLFWGGQLHQFSDNIGHREAPSKPDCQCYRQPYRQPHALTYSHGSAHA